MPRPVGCLAVQREGIARIDGSPRSQGLRGLGGGYLSLEGIGRNSVAVREFLSGILYGSDACGRRCRKGCRLRAWCTIYEL
jgi:hypothetical protein